jgi:murein DD-endopeptidase MepM/ murein hydrolase activator NlpD
MMRDFKVSDNDKLSFRRRKTPSSILWIAIPAIAVCGAIYASLQTTHEMVHTTPPDSTQTISVALELPSAMLQDGVAQQELTEDPLLSAPPSPAPTTPETENTPAPNRSPEPNSADTAPLTTSSQTTTTDLPSASDGQWLDREIRSGDNLAKIFKELDLSPQLLHRLVNSNKKGRALNHIRPGQSLRVHLDNDGDFVELFYQIDPAKKLHFSKNEDSISTQLIERNVDSKIKGISNSIESSLFGSAQRAGLSDALTMELAKIFQWDIDFALEIRAGDEFRVLFSEQWLDGEKLSEGPILAAEFINQGKIYRAVQYTDNQGNSSYFTPDGRQLRKEFLRTPVKFSRISSGFTKRRWHPVLKTWRSHKGVDYAAPTGTPVKAAGNGTVRFIGRKGGYGKVIFVQHPGQQTTVYGHLSRFAKGLKKGDRVKQGELIGYVGQTGLASGPHLHYEFRINGQHRNPLKVTPPPVPPLDKEQMPAFLKATEPLLVQLDGLLERTLVADARP